MNSPAFFEYMHLILNFLNFANLCIMGKLDLKDKKIQEYATMTTIFKQSIVFQVGKSVTVPAELASILQSTRFNRHFKFETPQATSATDQVKYSGFSLTHKVH